MAKQLIILFGVPGVGLDEAVHTYNQRLQREPGHPPAVTTTQLVELASGSPLADLVLAGQPLGPLFDAALSSALAGNYQMIAATGDELTRGVNQLLVRSQSALLVELKCDLQTQARRLGFNTPHSVGLGPVRAQLREQGRERRALWEGLANAIIDTSGWEMVQFAGLVDRILQGKI